MRGPSVAIGSKVQVQSLTAAQLFEGERADMKCVIPVGSSLTVPCAARDTAGMHIDAAHPSRFDAKSLRGFAAISGTLSRG